MNEIKTLTSYYSDESFECQIVEPDDLPRCSDWVGSLLNEDDMEEYEVYKNCVDHMYYAHIVEDIPF